MARGLISFVILALLFSIIPTSASLLCTLTGSEFRVDTYSSTSKFSTQIAPLTTGGAVAVWSSTNGHMYSAIFGQIFNAQGQRVGGEIKINAYNGGSVDQPQVIGIGTAAMLSATTTAASPSPSTTTPPGTTTGNFVVVWRSLNQDGSSYGVYGQQFLPAGITLGPEFKVNTYITNAQLNPQIVGLVKGGYVVVWESIGQDGSVHGIFGQVFNDFSQKIGVEFQANTYTASRQGDPVCVALAGGGFVVSWVSFEQDGSTDGIFGQVFSPTTAKIGTEFRVNSYTTQRQRTQAAAAFSEGGFVFLWESSMQDDGLSYGIFGQLFFPNGTKFGAEFPVNVFVTDFQSNPRVITLPPSSSSAATSGSATLYPFGTFVTFWESQGQSSEDGGGLFSRRFSLDYTTSSPPVLVPAATEERVNTYTTSEQYGLQVKALPYGGFVAVWESMGQDGNAAGIFGQQFSSSGTAIGAERPINQYTTSYQSQPKLAALVNGNYVVLWQSEGQGGGFYDLIYGQWFSCPEPTPEPTEAPTTPPPTTTTTTDAPSSSSPPPPSTTILDLADSTNTSSAPPMTTADEPHFFTPRPDVEGEPLAALNNAQQNNANGGEAAAARNPREWTESGLAWIAIIIVLLVILLVLGTLVFFRMRVTPSKKAVATV